MNDMLGGKINSALDKPIFGVYVFGGRNFEPGPSLQSAEDITQIMDVHANYEPDDLESGTPTSPSEPEPLSIWADDNVAPERDMAEDEQQSTDLDRAYIQQILPLYSSSPTPHRQLGELVVFIEERRGNTLTGKLFILSRNLESRVLWNLPDIDRFPNTNGLLQNMSTVASPPSMIRSSSSTPIASTRATYNASYSSSAATMESAIQDKSVTAQPTSPEDASTALAWSKMLHMMNGKMLGVSILAMPKAFEVLGLGVASVVVCVMAVIAYIGARAIWSFVVANLKCRNMPEVTQTLLSPFGRLAGRIGFCSGLILTTIFNFVSKLSCRHTF